MKVQEKREKGITLIALVITIIVLLILAGIAIAALSGENGILTRASEAKQKTGREEIVEKAKLEILEYEAENEGKITDEKALEIISKYDKDYKQNESFEFKTNENNEEYFITKEGYNILVKEIYKGRGKIHFILDGTNYICNEGAKWGDEEIRQLLNELNVVVGQDNSGKEAIYLVGEYLGGGTEYQLGELKLNENIVYDGDIISQNGNYTFDRWTTSGSASIMNTWDGK